MAARWASRALTLPAVIALASVVSGATRSCRDFGARSRADPYATHPLLGIILPVLVCVVLLLNVGTSQAQQGPHSMRLAVLPFGVNDLTGEVQQPDRLGTALATELEAMLVQSLRFSVMTRLDLDKILDEIALSVTGIVQPAGAREFGELAGVDIIVTGSITVFEADAISVSMRFISVDTGQVVFAGTWTISSAREFESIARDFVRRALERYPLQGSVIDVSETPDGTRAWIDIGRAHGVERSDAGIITRLPGVGEPHLGVRIGTLSVVELSEDRAFIRIDLDGDARPRTGDTVTITREAEGPRHGVVAVTTVPDDAEVVLDGVVRSSPFSITPGRHRVLIEAEGYAPRTLDLSVTAGQLVEHVVELSPLPGVLELLVSPGDAVVTIDGSVQTGDTLELAPGVYTLTIEAEAHEPLEHVVRIVPGRRERLQLDLRPSAPPTLLERACGAAPGIEAEGCREAVTMCRPFMYRHDADSLYVLAPYFDHERPIGAEDRAALALVQIVATAASELHEVHVATSVGMEEPLASEPADRLGGAQAERSGAGDARASVSAFVDASRDAIVTGSPWDTCSTYEDTSSGALAADTVTVCRTSGTIGVADTLVEVMADGVDLYGWAGHTRTVSITLADQAVHYELVERFEEEFDLRGGGPTGFRTTERITLRSSGHLIVDELVDLGPIDHPSSGSESHPARTSAEFMAQLVAPNTPCAFAKARVHATETP